MSRRPQDVPGYDEATQAAIAAVSARFDAWWVDEAVRLALDAATTIVEQRTASAIFDAQIDAELAEAHFNRTAGY